MLGRMFVTVQEAHAALLYENGRFQRELPAGRHALVTWPWRWQTAIVVDLRRTPLLVAGQEMLTADGLTVRVSLYAEFRVVNAPVALHSSQDFRDALYVLLQLLLREEVQGRSLDTLLGDRSTLGETILHRAQRGATELGLEMERVGLRDVVLPGDVRKMLAREAEALREGRAALVAAREETAATRARANTAQLMAANPLLLRLREIEALTEVAAGSGNTVVLALPPELAPAAAIARRDG